MELLVGAGLSGANGVVKAVTGKSILQHCGIAVNRLRANVLGIGAEYMGHALADKAADEAWKAAEAKLAGPDRDERLRFSCRLEALSDVLQSVASSRAVEDDSVKTALDNLRSSLERAFKAAGSDDGRRSSEADIDSYKQNLQQVFAAANAKRAEESHDEIREIREMLATEDSFKYDPYDSDSDQEASLLGEGSFGATHTMRNVDDGHLYAVKLINIKKARVPIENLRQEASRLRTLHHANIVRYYTSFTKKKFFAIVMELLTGGSLLERIDGAAGPLPDGQIKRWTIQIASALAHMHAQRMQHRDLKPDNVLFDALGDARLIDLGLAQIVVAKSKVSSKKAVGALLYRSPEKALGRPYDAKDDIWALGCMVAGAATGKSLEARCESDAGLFALDHKNVKSLVDEAASSTFGELVAATLAINPIARPAAEIIELALRRGKSLAAVDRDDTIFEEEEEDAAADALSDVPYAEVVGAEAVGDAPSENGLADSLGKVDLESQLLDPLPMSDDADSPVVASAPPSVPDYTAGVDEEGIWTRMENGAGASQVAIAPPPSPPPKEKKCTDNDLENFILFLFVVVFPPLLSFTMMVSALMEPRDNAAAIGWSCPLLLWIGGFFLFCIFRQHDSLDSNPDSIGTSSTSRGKMTMIKMDCRYWLGLLFFPFLFFAYSGLVGGVFNNFVAAMLIIFLLAFPCTFFSFFILLIDDSSAT